MLDLVLHGIFWAIFAVALVIELVSIYLDIRMMLGRSRVSGMWGFSLGLFSLLGIYGTFLASRRAAGQPYGMSVELKAVWAAIAFQVVFHVLLPLFLIWLRERRSGG